MRTFFIFLFFSFSPGGERESVVSVLVVLMRLPVRRRLFWLSVCFWSLLCATPWLSVFCFPGCFFFFHALPLSTLTPSHTQKKNPYVLPGPPLPSPCPRAHAHTHTHTSTLYNLVLGFFFTFAFLLILIILLTECLVSLNCRYAFTHKRENKMTHQCYESACDVLRAAMQRRAEHQGRERKRRNKKL